MTTTGDQLFARLRGEFEGADFESSRTLTRLRAELGEIVNFKGITPMEREAATTMLQGYMGRISSGLLTDMDRLKMLPVTEIVALHPYQKNMLATVVQHAHRAMPFALSPEMEQDLTQQGASNNDRRITEALQDLPAPFPTTRERGEKEQLARHLGALRARLDWLVKLEEEHGDQQKGLHQNRAERNALIAAMRQLGAGRA